MALASTTIAAAITADDRSFNLTSGTDAAAGRFLRVNDEFMYIQAVEGAKVTVQRGRWGTPSRAHGILSIAVHGAPADFTVPAAPRVYTYGADGAVTTKAGLHRIAKATAAALTIAQPSADQEGQELTFISTTAAAHTITTATDKYFNGATNNTATFGGAIGDCFTVVVVGGNWCVKAAKNVTLSAA